MSVFVEYDQWARMGNRMFQYAFANILSTKKNVPLYSDGLPNFNIPPTPRANTPVNPISTSSFGNNYVDYSCLLNSDRDIIINSYLQKSAYYVENKDFLRHIFSIKNNKPLNSNKLVVHIRETDYIQLNLFPGYDYYKSIIKHSGYNDVIIVTDNSDSTTIKKLVSEGCTLNSKGYVDTFMHHSDSRGMEDFYTLLFSENIFISQSSFSWWACFLGDHKKIFFPSSVKHGMWPEKPQQDDIDLALNWANIIKV